MTIPPSKLLTLHVSTTGPYKRIHYYLHQTNSQCQFLIHVSTQGSWRDGKALSALLFAYDISLPDMSPHKCNNALELWKRCLKAGEEELCVPIILEASGECEIVV